MSIGKKLFNSPLISPESLHKSLHSFPKSLPHILDTTFLLKPGNLSAHQLFRKCHIPKAKYFDIEECKDRTTDLPHMMPIEEDFARYMQDTLQISDTHAELVLYDQQGLFAAPRVWFMLRAFGHESGRVHILDGGLPGWQERGYEVEESSDTDDRPNIQSDITYHAKLDKSLLRDYNDVLNIIAGKEDAIIVDARPRGRFTGEDPDPRPHLQSGHMPGAVSLPFGELLKDGKYMKDVDEIKRIFESRGIRVDGGHQPNLVFSCGSGVTACVLARAADMLGFKKWSVYDGSWSEYASRKESKIVKDTVL